MNEPESKAQSTNHAVADREASAIVPSQETAGMAPSTGMATCPTCAGGAGNPPLSFVYAIGRVEARFPNLAAEKEFAQATGRTLVAFGVPRRSSWPRSYSTICPRSSPSKLMPCTSVR